MRSSVMLAALVALGAAASANPIVSVITLARVASGMCSWTYTSIYYSRSSLLGDVDGDGIKDILIANQWVVVVTPDAPLRGPHPLNAQV